MRSARSHLRVLRGAVEQEGPPTVPDLQNGTAVRHGGHVHLLVVRVEGFGLSFCQRSRAHALPLARAVLAAGPQMTEEEVRGHLRSDRVIWVGGFDEKKRLKH